MGEKPSREEKEIKQVYALDGDKMKCRNNWKTRKGGNGFGLSDEGCMYTLNTVDMHMVGIIYERKENTARGK